MLVLSSSNIVTEADLPEEIRRVPADNSAFWIELPEEGVSLEAVERELILRALEQAKGNQTKAAKYLDISRRTLIYRMEKYGLSTE
jgi:two-component system NtrC family response regulator